MNKFLKIAFSGVALGAISSAWFSPQIISWYFAPPVNMLVNCRPAVDWGMEVYRKCMLAGGILGGIAGVLIFFFLFKSSGTKKPT